MADRRLEIWGELAAQAAGRGSRASVADVCAVAAGSGQLSGAWVVAARDEEPEFLMCTTDPVCERLAELQLTLGEGPCHDVLASAAPVLAAGLGDAESSRRWPVFTPQAREGGAGAVFAFPLIVGAIRAWVLGLYCRSAGPLHDGQLGDLLVSCRHGHDAAARQHRRRRCSGRPRRRRVAGRAVPGPGDASR
jgi:hypothetical protein